MSASMKPANQRPPRRPPPEAVEPIGAVACGPNTLGLDVLHGYRPITQLVISGSGPHKPYYVRLRPDEVATLLALLAQAQARLEELASGPGGTP